VERPKNLLIKNKYQQQLSPVEYAGLVPFSPFSILNSNDVLGDGFTACMKAEFSGALYFLLKEDDGALAGDVGFRKVVKAAALLNDTIEIVAKRGATLTIPHGESQLKVQRGATLVRVFRENSLTYVQSVFPKQYGWVKLDVGTEGKVWKRVRNAAASTSEELLGVLPKITDKVEAVNQKLKQLFNHFNSKTSSRLRAPQWRLQTSTEGVICVLDASPPEQFVESSALLGKHIESVLLGTRLRVDSSPGRIEIH
jgi:hypothetical protein